MKYETRMINVDRVGKPSVIPLKSTDEEKAKDEFRRLRRAHGDESVLKLHLYEIDDGGNQREVPVSK